MRLSNKYKILLKLYEAAWFAALPFLAFSGRLSGGMRKRLVPDDWVPQAGWQDIWIQAASGGEAYLAWEILKRIKPVGKGNILLTSWTEQGLSVLDKAVTWCRKHRPEIKPRRAFFPYDMPHLMHRALYASMPKAVVLLETELWPGLLAACAEQEVPVVLVNGRLSGRSLPGYLTVSAFLRATAPQKVLAISDRDAKRYGAVFGMDKVDVMSNIKFDRFAPQPQEEAGGEATLADIFKPGSSFVVLGSVRKEEEEDVEAIITALRKERPKTTIGLFPRHRNRTSRWVEFLNREEIPWTFRSRIKDPVPAGSVILWDVFGELSAAYKAARAAFVGGSLKPLGGQNFLEPLAHGIVPVIGPHWTNFAWVGRQIIEKGLLEVGKNTDEVVEKLLKTLKRPKAPAQVKNDFDAYMKQYQGGTEKACRLIEATVRSQADRAESAELLKTSPKKR